MLVRIILVLILVAFLTRCNTHEDKSKIENYITESFENNAFSNNHLYVFIPKNMCSTCINGLIEYFNTLSEKGKDKITAIFIGSSQKNLKLLTKDLSDKDWILLDAKEKAFETGIVDFSHTTIFISRSENKSEVLSFPENNLFLITNTIDEFINEN